MNKWMNTCAFVLVSTNVFQTAVFAQGQNRSPYVQQGNQMPAEQRRESYQMHQFEQRNPNDEQETMQGWTEYHETWTPSYDSIKQAETQNPRSYTRQGNQMPTEQRRESPQMR